MLITWNKDLDTGIELIDEQHRQIVEFINKLQQAVESGEQTAVGEILEECIDYTLSHFSFEEELQQEAGYEFYRPHKKVHELFTRRVEKYREQFKNGEDVAPELHKLLANWLVNHIKHDDADYVSAVKTNMDSIIKSQDEKKGAGWIDRLFSRAK